MQALALSSFEEAPTVLPVDDPSPGPGEVLVRVAAASVNAYDVVVAAGAMRDQVPYAFPVVLGGDLAGTVEALGEDVEGFSVGERVFGMTGKAVGGGSFAELSTPRTRAIAAAPEGLRDADAGSLAVAGTTAVSAVDAVSPVDGARLLVLGATGGLGAFAVQLARLRGAYVIASARPGDEDFVTGLGAAEIVDYTGDLVAAIRARFPEGLDAVIDAVSGDPDAFGEVAALVRDGGRAVSSRGAAGESTAIGAVTVSNANGNAAHLGMLAELVVRGELRVPVRRTYGLGDASRALEDFSREHTVGKLLITM
jgi:NADPH:quinone reductase-like Zn-dependent oxidoreductase